MSPNLLRLGARDAFRRHAGVEIKGRIGLSESANLSPDGRVF